MFNKADFILSYGQVISNTWDDAAYLNRLETDPRGVLTEVGIEVPEEAQIALVPSTNATGHGDPNVFIDRWAKGYETGVFELVVPTRPADFDPDDVVLSDELLSSVAGGLSEVEASGDYYCCCCTPCCCCS